ncbi:ParB N-terminal domain-containing protein [Nocardioides sp. YIM B13467]|uniref:ParB N-terminal domain-containing protein n=1 Tax=Nocardioides sp. YIM B13467 TaxID=3366294 RepID=UPI00367102A6
MSPESHTERALDAITIGVRHRHDLGDIDELANSINEIGMLQPITITPDGVLVCGRRRLEAVRSLGWRTIKVWIRSGISNRLTELLAQQDENSLHKPLSPTEQADLYTELKTLYAEEAQRRQEASRFGTVDVDSSEILAGVNGSGDSPEPSPGARESRYQAAKMVTGSGSYQRLDHIKFLQAVATDTFQPPTVRDLASAELAAVEAGSPVEPAYRKVRAAIELAARPSPEDDTLDRLASEALERVKHTKRQRRAHESPAQPAASDPDPKRYRPLRSFLMTWFELDGWTAHYDLDQIARELADEEYGRFDQVITESVAFRDRLAAARRATHESCVTAVSPTCSRRPTTA